MHPRQMVLSCCGPANSYDCQTKFEPVLTELGICYAFNPISFNKSFNSGLYASHFQNIFGPEESDTSQPLKITEAGKSFQMHITLDSHTSRNEFKKSDGEFYIGISQGRDFMRMTNNGIRAKIGHHTAIKISPSLTTGTKRFLELPLHERQCRLLEEVENTISFFK